MQAYVLDASISALDASLSGQIVYTYAIAAPKLFPENLLAEKACAGPRDMIIV
jgi:hypothetical protein